MKIEMLRTYCFTVFFLLYAAVSEAWFKANGDKEMPVCALSSACESARKSQGVVRRFPI